MTDLITCINDGIADETKDKKADSPVKVQETETLILTKKQKEYLIKVIQRDQKNRKAARERYWKIKAERGPQPKRVREPAVLNDDQIKEVSEKIKSTIKD